MGNDPVKYYACRITGAAMYPTWGTVRPPCSAYITTQINDIRPIFNLQVTEPTAADPPGRAIFFVSDVDAAGAPLYWQGKRKDAPPQSSPGPSAHAALIINKLAHRQQKNLKINTLKK